MSPRKTVAEMEKDQAESSHKPRILIVDDDITVRSLGEHNLGAAEFKVVTVAEGGKCRGEGVGVQARRHLSRRPASRCQWL